jgi:3-oxoacyl-(acyl-carrier-protein) synthase
MGVVAPTARNVPEFQTSLRAGASGIVWWPEAASLGMGCQVIGMPEFDAAFLNDLLPPPRRRTLSLLMEYAAAAAIECWRDAGLLYDPELRNPPDWNAGTAVGLAVGPIDVLTETVAPLVAQQQHRQMGSRIAERSMASGAAAALSGIFGLGGPAITVSSACCSGTAAIHQGIQTLRLGRCQRMLVGGVEIRSLHIAAMFDSMRVLCRDFNDQPERASRPLSATAGGFVPAGGAGFLLLETIESAHRRGARIHAELAGSFENSGGQRGDGTMTLAHSEGAVRCIQGALADAGVRPEEIDYVNGHLTGTLGDPKEARNLSEALGRPLKDMPWINATKSLVGHTLGAAGAIESIATILQLRDGFLHPSRNCEDLRPELAELAPHVPTEPTSFQFQTALKTSFGFGDVNSCLVFRRYEETA